LQHQCTIPIEIISFGRENQMNGFQRVAHRVVSSLANDMRENTLSWIAGAALGGAGGGYRAYRAATTGFTMLERQVVRKTATAAATGAAVGGWGGSRIAETAQKVMGVEKWFDNTRVGKAIDNGITKVENFLHRLIGGGSY
jgi:hypothetical protein